MDRATGTDEDSRAHRSPLPQRVLVIFNPAAGQGDPEALRRELAEKLEELEVEFEIRETEGEGDACRWARAAGAEGFGIVIAAGGDGTIAEAASGIVRAERRVPLACVPAGTANVVAAALSIPTQTGKAIDLLGRGRPVAFDVGFLPERDRHFLLMVGIGIPGEMVHEAPRELKDRLGPAAYLFAGVRSLLNPKGAQLRLEADGRTWSCQGHTILVLNIGSLGALGLRDGAVGNPHDGQLDIELASGETPLDAVRSMVRFLRGDSRGSKLIHRRAGTVRIEADPPLAVQADGEAVGETPVTVEILPGAIEIWVPESYET